MSAATPVSFSTVACADVSVTGGNVTRNRPGSCCAAAINRPCGINAQRGPRSHLRWNRQDTVDRKPAATLIRRGIGRRQWNGRVYTNTDLWRTDQPGISPPPLS